MSTIAKLREMEKNANTVDARIQLNGHAVGEVMHNGISLSSARWYYIQMLQKNAPALLDIAEAAKKYQKVSRDMMKGTAGILNVKGAGDALDDALAKLDEVEL